MPEVMTIPRTRQGVRNLDEVKGPVLPFSGGPAPAAGVNVGSTERLLCGLGGGVLTAFGLCRGTLTGLGLALVGGALAYRAYTGHCPAYKALGMNTTGADSRDTGAEMVYRAL